MATGPEPASHERFFRRRLRPHLGSAGLELWRRPAFNPARRRGSPVGFARQCRRKAVHRDTRRPAVHRNTISQPAVYFPGRKPPQFVPRRLGEPAGPFRQSCFLFWQRLWRREQWSQRA